LRNAACNPLAGAVLGALALAGCQSSTPSDYVATAPQPETARPQRDALGSQIAHYAKLHSVPESLVHAQIRRESGYDPAARNGPYWGLMQIRYDTARSMGYRGDPTGLLDADTNLAYAVPYLANAYLVSGGDERRAMRLYASGYYFEAKRQGLLDRLHIGER
jgi:soluble lytic murein transglycosylase-like protein